MVISKKIKVKTYGQEKTYDIKLDSEKSKFDIKTRDKNFYQGLKVLNLRDKNKQGAYRECVDIRFYNSKSTNYCAIWISNNKTWLQGTGKASGWGYDRELGALNDALANCGFDGLPDAGGLSVNYMVDIICKFLNIKKYQVVNCFS